MERALRLIALALAAVVLTSCGPEAPKKSKKKPEETKATTPAPVDPSKKETIPGLGGAERTTGKPDLTPNPNPVRIDDPPKPAQPPLGMKVGNRAPELVLQDADGATFALSSYKGKSAVLIVFGATWCPTCKAGLPALRKFVADAQGKAVETVEIFMQEDAEKAKAYAAANDLKHRLLPDVRDISRAKYKYVVPEMPHHILVGKDGIIVSSGGFVPGAAELEKALK